MDDRSAMRRALELSRAALGRTSPNPPVGAVVLDRAGKVVGEGVTQRPGGPHAEVVALRLAGSRAAGGTVAVTLEPCDHTGRTGPCSEALVAAGVARVVVGCPDPTAAAAGGADRLRAAGVGVTQGVLADEVAAGPLDAWLHRQATGRPLVTWKYAATLDGRSAAVDGTSRWITGEAARADVHRLRAENDAVVVGVGTVLADDPALTVRPPDGRTPLRVVVDSSGRTPATARVLDGRAPTLVVTAGATVAGVETAVAGSDRVDLGALLDLLAARGVVSVLLEGGPVLAGAFWQAGLVDRVVGYVAPTLLGAGPAALGVAGVGTISNAVRLQMTDVRRFGQDLRLSLRRA